MWNHPGPLEPRRLDRQTLEIGQRLPCNDVPYEDVTHWVNLDSWSMYSLSKVSKIDLFEVISSICFLLRFCLNEFRDFDNVTIIGISVLVELFIKSSENMCPSTPSHVSCNDAAEVAGKIGDG